MIPKVFVSHASEDKNRFVLNFAKRLRENGIDAWLDKWEMLPGDSLVDKIFEEGLKYAQAIIIVISNNSINKPWVKEELNSSMIKKINSGSKLIPVVIDNCDVPECLKSTVWQQITDINNYDEEFNRIVLSIMGQTEKPPIGRAPKYVSTIIDNFSGLNKIDSIIFKIACENAIKNNSLYLKSDCVYQEANNFGIDKSNSLDTLDILDRKGFINATRVLTGDIPVFSITTYGFNQYINIYVSDFNYIMERVCFNLVNKQLDNYAISSELNKSVVIVNHAYDLLKQKGLIDFKMTIGGNIIVFNISPELKRILQ